MYGDGRVLDSIFDERLELFLAEVKIDRAMEELAVDDPMSGQRVGGYLDELYLFMDRPRSSFDEHTIPEV